MKRILLFFLLISISFSSNFGKSVIELERQWTISETTENIEFEGALAVNNSFQKVISIETEPGMNISVSDEGEIRLSYNSTPEGNTLKARATIEVEHNPEIYSDYPLQRKNPVFTDYTQPDEDIRATAEQLAVNDSMLETMLELVKWTNKNIEYDVSYFENPRSAEEVFRDRRGVCVEFSHLLISLAGSLGIETRYVSGYVYSGGWQPHAWVEFYLPEHGWIAADPTFAQIGPLDNSHVAVAYGGSQESIFDIISSREEVLFSTTENITIKSDSEKIGLSSHRFEFDNRTMELRVNTENLRDTYYYGIYEFVSPKEYWGVSSEPVLFLPGETSERTYHIDSDFQPGFKYTIPVSASLNDDSSSFSIEITRPAAEQPSQEPVCLSFLVLVFAGTLLLKTS